jgi:hypothetical protein
METVPPAPILPEGWRVEHSHQYSCPYYVNIYTQESIWTFPTAPALHAQNKQSAPTQQNNTSSSPAPINAGPYLAGTAVIVNGQSTPVYSPLEQAKQAYFPPSQNTQQQNQANYVQAPVPNSGLPVIATNSVPSVVNQNQQQLHYQAPGASSQVSSGQSSVAVVPVSSGTPIVGQRDANGQPPTQGTVLQQQPSVVQQIPSHQSPVQTIQAPIGSPTSYNAPSWQPQSQAPYLTSVGNPQPQQQSHSSQLNNPPSNNPLPNNPPPHTPPPNNPPSINPQPSQQASDHGAPPLTNSPVSERKSHGRSHGFFERLQVCKRR